MQKDTSTVMSVMTALSQALSGPTDLTAILLAALLAKYVPGPSLQGDTARMRL